MIKFYVFRIKEGKMTIDQVPEKWRADVEAELKSQGITEPHPELTLE